MVFENALNQWFLTGGAANPLKSQEGKQAHTRSATSEVFERKNVQSNLLS